MVRYNIIELLFEYFQKFRDACMRKQKLSIGDKSEAHITSIVKNMNIREDDSRKLFDEPLSTILCITYR